MPDPPREPAGLELQVVRPGVCYAALGRVFLLHYYVTPTRADLEARLPILERLAKRHPEGVAYLSVIEAEHAAGLPDTEARNETARQIELFEDVLVGGATTVHGDTLRITLLRTFLRTLMVIRRGSVPLRFFSTVEEAAGWCLSHLGYEGADLAARRDALVDAAAVMAEAGRLPDDAPPTETDAG